MTDILLWLAAILLVPAVIVAAYHALLAVVALLPGRRAADAPPRDRFVIVIPAHNEEAILGRTIRSCLRQEYPRELFDVVVIADNCTDRTAAVARLEGAECLERHDTTLRGKGYALTWGFDRLLPRGHDAVVVVDADCELSPNALACFNARFVAGDLAAQASFDLVGPEATAMNDVLMVGNVLENRAFCAPKSRLGLSVFLRGSGMALRRELLERQPWAAHSIVEDVEYSMNLFRAGVPVRFVPEASVTSLLPGGQQELDVQRSRWVGGTLHLFARTIIPTLATAIRRRNGRLLDAAWTLLIQSRPLILLHLAAAAALAALCLALAPGAAAYAMSAAAVALMAFYAAYFALGVIWLRRMGRPARNLPGVPAAAGRYMATAIAGVWRFRPGQWIRTPRTMHE